MTKRACRSWSSSEGGAEADAAIVEDRDRAVSEADDQMRLYRASGDAIELDRIEAGDDVSAMADGDDFPRAHDKVGEHVIQPVAKLTGREDGGRVGDFSGGVGQATTRLP